MRVVLRHCHLKAVALTELFDKAGRHPSLSGYVPRESIKDLLVGGMRFIASAKTSRDAAGAIANSVGEIDK